MIVPAASSRACSAAPAKASSVDSTRGSVAYLRSVRPSRRLPSIPMSRALMATSMVAFGLAVSPLSPTQLSTARPVGSSGRR